MRFKKGALGKGVYFSVSMIWLTSASNHPYHVVSSFSGVQALNGLGVDWVGEGVVAVSRFLGVPCYHLDYTSRLRKLRCIMYADCCYFASEHPHSENSAQRASTSGKH